MIYGINTGFGPMAQWRVDDRYLTDLQYNITPQPLDRRRRAAARPLCPGGDDRPARHPAAGPFGHPSRGGRSAGGVHQPRHLPFIPEHGSVGASGDLVQLAHIALTLIGEAVFSRCLSAIREERVAASKALAGPKPAFAGDREQCVEAIRQALYASKIVSYAQGYQLMRAAANTYGWNLNYGGIALMWRGGCIIRSVFLGKIKEAFDRDPNLVNLMLDPFFADQLAAAQDYPAFYQQEIMFRKFSLYPPFCSFCVVSFSGAQEMEVFQAARRFAAILGQQFAAHPGQPLRVLGPTPMNIAMISGKYRYKLTLKCRNDAGFRTLMHAALDAYAAEKLPAKAGMLWTLIPTAIEF